MHTETEMAFDNDAAVWSHARAIGLDSNADWIWLQAIAAALFTMPAMRLQQHPGTSATGCEFEISVEDQ